MAILTTDRVDQIRGIADKKFLLDCLMEDYYGPKVIFKLELNLDKDLKDLTLNDFKRTPLCRKRSWFEVQEDRELRYLEEYYSLPLGSIRSTLSKLDPDNWTLSLRIEDCASDQELQERLNFRKSIERWLN